MGLFDQFPYTNFHELNLDWLLRMMKELNNTVENFVALNTIKYADPIQWNITTQYEANTVVVDPQTGTAYISSKPVPAGVALTYTDYWSVIFTLDMLSANDNITLRDDGSNILSTFASNAGDWLLWNGNLYKVSQSINLNEAYVVGYNLDRYTVEMFISDYITELKTEIGDLTDLNTTDKDNLVNAINEILSTLTSTTGDLTDLNTTDQSNLVAAINEVNNKPDPTPTYLTVADMIAADLEENTVVNTLGYYAYNDGGGASYIIKTSSSTVHETLNNGLVAELLFTDTINVLQVGAKGDGVTDDLAAFNTAINNASTIIVPRGNDKTYILSGSITLGIRQNLVCDTPQNCASYPRIKFTTGGLIINGRNVTVNGVSIETIISELAVSIGVAGGASLPHIKISNCYIYKGRWGIITNVNAWMFELENVRFSECASGLYLNNCGPCVSLKNVYFDRCTTIQLMSTDSRFSAIGCNFGFLNGSDIRLTSTQAEFIDCNFECDETVSNRLFNISGRQIKFECCKFGLDGATGCYLFGSSSSLWSLIFENCIVGYQGASAGSGFKPPITVRDDFGAYSYGSILIGKGCQNISLPSPLYDSQYPYFINHSENGVMNFKGTSVLADHLHAGNVLYSLTINKMCYFDGTNVRRMDTDAVIV